MTPTPGDGERAAAITSVREALLTLHKALIDLQRSEHERAHGRRLTPGELLQLLTGDQAFDWLHPFSQLIVAIDELLERDPPPSERDAAAVRVEVELILAGARYTASVDREPDVAVAHSRTLLALERLPAAPAEEHAELRALRPGWRGPRKRRGPAGSSAN
jgi:hypothetical protein